MIKRMSGNKKKEYGYPIMKDGEKIIILSKSKAELLARTFVEIDSRLMVI